VFPAGEVEFKRHVSSVTILWVHSI
jgi:hypothetical protein